jgi:cation diffusion facilitator CzcD-associated flavoprotein CzcO
MGVELKPEIFQTAVKAPAAQTSCEAAVIGAGPYGLGVAAHLRATGLSTQAFGEPMGFWRRNMPKGMWLRSPWRGSHIPDPQGKFRLEAFAAEIGVAPAENMPLEQFVRYGEWFQSHAVPDLDTRKVSLVERHANGFRLTLADGDSMIARRVVIAMGLRNQDYRPREFKGLPQELVSHSSDHADFARFKNKHVVVLGRGQSAVESAVLLSEAGAKVDLLSHGPVIWLGGEESGGAPRQALSMDGFRSGPSAVGPFPLNWLIDMPDVTRRLPDAWRDWISTRSLRPAATAWLRPRSKNVRINDRRNVVSAHEQGGKVVLALNNGVMLTVDHVLLATGYRMDVAKFGIFAPDLLARIETVDGYPKLAAGLESSVPRLHFVGSTAVRSIGGLMRFVAGAGYAARSVTRAAHEGRR